MLLIDGISLGPRASTIICISLQTAGGLGSQSRAIAGHSSDLTGTRLPNEGEDPVSSQTFSEATWLFTVLPTKAPPGRK